MKKGVVVVFGLLVVFSLVNLASASWLSDFWGKISGNVVSEASLVSNLDFEGDFASWGHHNWNDKKSNYSDGTEVIASGTECYSGKCLKMRHNSASWQGAYQLSTGGLEIGKTYQLSAKFKTTASHYGYINLNDPYWQNSSCKQVGKSFTSYALGNNNWKDINVTVTVPEKDDCGNSVASHRWYVYLYGELPLADNSFLYYDGVSLVKLESSTPVPPVVSCNDSDEGSQSWYTRGTTKGCFSNGTCGNFTDSCASSIKIREYLCSEGVVYATESNCFFDNLCENGACKKSNAKCTDSDGGVNFDVKGTLTIVGYDGKNYTSSPSPYPYVSYTDSCLTNGRLSELSCENVIVNQDCPYGCNTGYTYAPPAGKMCSDGKWIDCVNENCVPVKEETCLELLNKVRFPQEFIQDGYGNTYTLNWNYTYRENYWFDGQEHSATSYYAGWERSYSSGGSGSEAGNRHYYYPYYRVSVFDDKSLDLTSFLEQQMSWSLCRSELVQDTNGEDNVVYLCTYAYDVINNQNSPWQYLKAFWINKNVLVEFNLQEGRSLTNEEYHQLGQEKISSFLNDLKDNNFKWANLYLNYPLDGIIKQDISACKSELEAQIVPGTNETCESQWECKIEPVICPPHGAQTQICRDVWCDQPDKEQEMQCSPGICAGCMIPRWIGNSNNICMPYGFRFAFEKANEGGKISMNELLSIARETNASVEITPESVLKISFNSQFPILFTANGRLYGNAGDSAEVRAGERYIIEFNERNYPEKYDLIVDKIAYSENVEDSYIEITIMDNFNAYCDVDGRVKQQKIKQYDGSWAQCQNNYECDSNLCSGGECVEINALLKEATGYKAFGVRILCTFANLFGIQEYNSCVSGYLGKDYNSGGSSGGGGGSSSPSK